MLASDAISLDLVRALNGLGTAVQFSPYHARRSAQDSRLYWPFAYREHFGADQPENSGQSFLAGPESSQTLQVVTRLERPIDRSNELRDPAPLGIGFSIKLLEPFAHFSPAPHARLCVHVSKRRRKSEIASAPRAKRESDKRCRKLI